jgi:hypothetical protein
MGCPIRISTDQVVCADPRSFSQLITSFFAYESQGIPRAPLSTFLYQSIYPKIYTPFYSLLLFFAQYVNELFIDYDLPSAVSSILIQICLYISG